jgi:hypothetical protein
MKTLEDRARAAYFRRFGTSADQPSVSVDENEGIVELSNVNGILGAYRITSDGGLRWDEQRLKRPQREREIEDIVQEMDGDELIDFAEAHCDWLEADYFATCVSDGHGGWVPADGSDYSIVDAAMDSIREWAMDDANFLVLQKYRRRQGEDA